MYSGDCRQAAGRLYVRRKKLDRSGPVRQNFRVKVTKYFASIRQRPDRAMIQEAWIQQVIDRPVREEVQQDGRIRRWAAIKAMDGRYLRVILLPDRETVHNAFFDRSFRP